MTITNTHDQLVASNGGVAITPAQTQGRSPRFYGWTVYRIDAKGREVVTDCNAAWYNYGRKTFSATMKGRMESLQEAKEWVAAQGWYDGKWVRNRMFDYVPADVNKRFPLPR